MFVEHFLIPEANEANVYLLACSETRRAALIDAGGFEHRVVDCARENSFHVQYILVTHDHYDHVGGLASYVQAFPGCEVIAGGANPGGISARAPADGGPIHVGKLKGTALAIPGHTEDSMAWLFEAGDDSACFGLAPAVVFCGDVLFAGSIGGTFGSAAHEQEIQGIRRKLFTLPDNTVLYPGHGPATTVGIEKHHSPFFGL